jgi:uncharacterized tellurite resistance protein B-like protein
VYGAASEREVIMDVANKLAVCKVVAQAILSDGEIPDEERAFLDKLMERYGLDPAQRREVLHRNVGDDPAELVRGIDDPEAREALLRELARAVATDGVLAAAEEQLLARVAEALGVPREKIEDLIADAVLES